ncbi:MAG: Crp/Fnr family transcriptional regulator [Flavobacteriaceae bacterium]|nr:Crp/Fnr family transcriptional regulator [Flavobacteriaceae bacterium]
MEANKQTLHRHINKQILLDAVAFDRFFSCFQTLRFEKGERIITPGQATHHQYFVAKGCLRTFLLGADGKEHTIQFAIENWWVSDYIAYYRSSPAVLTVECLETCELLKVSKDALFELFDEFPLIERFFRLQLENAFVAYQTRILANLQESAETRYLNFVAMYPDIDKRVKNYQIASFLGITPESLSRLRKLRFTS